MADNRDWMSDLLESVQAAPPVKSVAVMARILQEQLAAEEVSFLITDLRRQCRRPADGVDGQGARVEPRAASPARAPSTSG